MHDYDKIMFSENSVPTFMFIENEVLLYLLLY